jgi:adenine specific DNA methylase Mod
VTFHDGDNLIIKGNNLLAIASLLKRYEGKVKCIYIDPPYYFNEKERSRLIQNIIPTLAFRHGWYL